MYIRSQIKDTLKTPIMSKNIILTYFWSCAAVQDMKPRWASYLYLAALP